MAQTPRLELRARTELSLTPQLRQAIKMLQMSQLELDEFVDATIAENPMLEQGDAKEESLDKTQEGQQEQQTEQQTEQDRASDEPEQMDSYEGLTQEVQEASLKERELDVDLSNTYDGEIFERRASAEGSGESLIERTKDTESLYDYLRKQIGEEFTDPRDRLLAYEISGCMDTSGLLEKKLLQDLSKRMGCTQDMLDRVVDKMQRFEPVGLFARSLEECLALQLKSLGEYDETYDKMFEKLGLVAEGRIAELASFCEVTQDTLMDYLTRLKSLNPHPARSFEDTLEPEIRIPDLIVRQEKSEITVHLNPEAHRQVKLNSNLYERMRQGRISATDKGYMREKWQSARWLERSLEQRTQTILAVGKAIVKRQQAFFEHGVMNLRPLVLRQIAEDTQMHESTISRVTNSKYLLSERGIFELKYFFQASIVGGLGYDHSAAAVRERIAKLTEQETLKNIYSDEAIVEELSKDGIHIARRTVAKYREAMNIPSSAVRRRLKKSRKTG